MGYFTGFTRTDFLRQQVLSNQNIILWLHFWVWGPYPASIQARDTCTTKPHVEHKSVWTTSAASSFTNFTQIHSVFRSLRDSDLYIPKSRSVWKHCQQLVAAKPSKTTIKSAQKKTMQILREKIKAQKISAGTALHKNCARIPLILRIFRVRNLVFSPINTQVGIPQIVQLHSHIWDKHHKHLINIWHTTSTTKIAKLSRDGLVKVWKFEGKYHAKLQDRAKLRVTWILRSFFNI